MYVQGIASELMNLVVQHLKAINCTQIMLHASPQGKPVYKRLGFEADDSSLVLKLSHQVPGVV